MSQIDIAIIGGSFAGISAGMYAARARQEVVIFDDGKNRNRFATSAHGLFGHDGKAPTDLKQQGRAQFLRYPTASFYAQPVESIVQKGERFELVSADEKTFVAKRLVLAHGVADILPEIPGALETWGRSLLQCPYCHGYEVKGQRFGVLYSGEATLHQLRILPDWSPKLTLLMNGERLNTEQQAEVAKLGVSTMADKIESFEHKRGQLEAIKFAGGESFECDAVFSINRHRLTNNFGAKLGCELDEGHFGPMIKVDNLQQTTNPGVFAAGDCARSIHNSAWAVSDGASAGIFAHQSIVAGRNPYQEK